MTHLATSTRAGSSALRHFRAFCVRSPRHALNPSELHKPSVLCGYRLNSRGLSMREDPSKPKGKPHRSHFNIAIIPSSVMLPHAPDNSSSSGKRNPPWQVARQHERDGPRHAVTPRAVQVPQARAVMQRQGANVQVLAALKPQVLEPPRLAWIQRVGQRVSWLIRCCTPVLRDIGWSE
jgi:hypothetical protein